MSGRRATPAVLWALAGLTGLGLAVRFASLGVQSYHHDEVITVARVIPGSFAEMLRAVKNSESNPPLYYVVAWGWAKAFGTGEVGMRSLSALLGAATVPVAFLAAREAASARAGLIAAAIVAVNPMLIWYSQEARSYALLVLLGAVSLLFFLRALRSGAASDLAFWALASAGALCSHYFAVFAVAIEAAWLLIALRSRWRAVLPAVAGVGLVGLALLPLIAAQVNPPPHRLDRRHAAVGRLLQTGISFLAGETGHVIAEPPRERYALVPAALVGVALLLLALRGSGRERRGALPPLAVGLGVAALASLAALAGKDYVVERNLLPALVPLASWWRSASRRAGPAASALVCATLLCAYWLGYRRLRRPHAQPAAPRLPRARREARPAVRPRAIVSWKLAGDPLRFYLHDDSERVYSGAIPLREIDVVGKPVAKRQLVRLPRTFHQVERIRLERLTLIRYVSRGTREVPFRVLRELPTGFGSDAVVVDGQPAGCRGAALVEGGRLGAGDLAAGAGWRLVAGAGKDLEVRHRVVGGGRAVVAGQGDHQPVEARRQFVVVDLRPGGGGVAAAGADSLGEHAVGARVAREVEGGADQAPSSERALLGPPQLCRVDAVGDPVEREADVPLAELRLLAEVTRRELEVLHLDLDDHRAAALAGAVARGDHLDARFSRQRGPGGAPAAIAAGHRDRDADRGKYRR